MAWEQRGSHHYYYRSRKIGGRVVKEYVGAGVAGQQAEREDETRRLKQASERAALLMDRNTFDSASAAHIELSRTADAILTATLLAAGYHRHDRGKWRKRRASKVDQ
jgi:hypothetical protein